MPSSRRGGRTSDSGEGDSFRSFLVGLATDPAKLGQFMKDPDGSMSDAGLTEEDKAIVLSGNLGAINARIRGQAAPRPAPLLVVDMAGEDESGEAAPIVRGTPMAPLEVYPQIVMPVQPVIQHQVVYPQIVYPQIHPQIVYPQIHPQIVYPQIYPQVHPQIYPQIVYPQIHPQIFPQIHPQIVYPQIHPVIYPQIYPQIHPLIYPEAPAGGNPVSQ